MPKIQVELVFCNGCGICVSVCSAFVLELFDEKVTMVKPWSLFTNQGKTVLLRATISWCRRRIKN